MHCSPTSHVANRVVLASAITWQFNKTKGKGVKKKKKKQTTRNWIQVQQLHNMPGVTQHPLWPITPNLFNKQFSYSLVVAGRVGEKCCTTVYWILNVTAELQGLARGLWHAKLVEAQSQNYLSHLAALQGKHQKCLEGDAKPLWLCMLKRYGAAICKELAALLLCSGYSILSDKRTHSICQLRLWSVEPAE